MSICLSTCCTLGITLVYCEYCGEGVEEYDTFDGAGEYCDRYCWDQHQQERQADGF